MRIFVGVLAALLFAGIASAVVTDVKTGRDLVDACKIFAAKDENVRGGPDRCRAFLVGFFTAYVESERARQDALVKGLPAKATTACVRMPDFLSYREMAGRVVAFAEKHPDELNGPATALAQHTLEADFPCPTQP